MWIILRIRRGKENFNEILIFKGLETSSCWDCKSTELQHINFQTFSHMFPVDRRQLHTVIRPTKEGKKNPKQHNQIGKKEELYLDLAFLMLKGLGPGQQSKKFPFYMCRVTSNRKKPIDSKVPRLHLYCRKPLLVPENLQNSFSYPEAVCDGYTWLQAVLRFRLTKKQVTNLQAGILLTWDWDPSLLRVETPFTCDRSSVTDNMLN